MTEDELDENGRRWMAGDEKGWQLFWQIVIGGAGQGGYDQEGSDYNITSDVFAEAMNQNLCKE